MSEQKSLGQIGYEGGIKLCIASGYEIIPWDEAPNLAQRVQEAMADAVAAHVRAESAARIEELEAEVKASFCRGVATSATFMAKDHHEEDFALHILKQAGITLKVLNSLGLDDYDLKPLRKVLRDDPKPIRRAALKGGSNALSIEDPLVEAALKGSRYMITFVFKGYPAKIDRKTALFAGTAKIERVNQYYRDPNERWVVLETSAKDVKTDEPLIEFYEPDLARWLKSNFDTDITARLDKADAERARAA